MRVGYLAYPSFYQDYQAQAKKCRPATAGESQDGGPSMDGGAI